MMSSKRALAALLALVALLVPPSAGAGAPPPPPPAEGTSVARINGQVPPGTVTGALSVQLLSRTPAGPGYETRVYRSFRPAGTRTPIHFHDHGGTTCVLEGRRTMVVEGRPPKVYTAGQCFSMPPGLPMTSISMDRSAVIDVFTTPIGAADVWRPVEPGHKGMAGQFETP